jgi:hypothetical protein
VPIKNPASAGFFIFAGYCYDHQAFHHSHLPDIKEQNMKMVKMIVMAAPIALLAFAMQATALPAYHMVDDFAIGKATIQSSGSCKINQVYENARWGMVYDSMNQPISYGILSSGDELLALEESAKYISGVDDAATGKGNDVYYENLGSSETVAKIQSLGSCVIRELIPSAKTKGTFTRDPSKGKNDWALVYLFNGISPPLNTTNGTKSVYKAQPFSGKITFKGSYPPGP